MPHQLLLPTERFIHLPFMGTQRIVLLQDLKRAVERKRLYGVSVAGDSGCTEQPVEDAFVNARKNSEKTRFKTSVH